MSIETILLTAGAAVVAAWPKLVSVLKWVRIPPPLSTAVTYQEAMAALAVVRTRLVSAGGLSDSAAKAITVITQDLVSGSDK